MILFLSFQPFFTMLDLTTGGAFKFQQQKTRENHLEKSWSPIFRSQSNVQPNRITMDRRGQQRYVWSFRSAISDHPHFEMSFSRQKKQHIPLPVGTFKMIIFWLSLSVGYVTVVPWGFFFFNLGLLRQNYHPPLVQQKILLRSYPSCIPIYQTSDAFIAPF